MEKIWRFFLNSGRIMAIENLKKRMSSALLIFNIAFWLYIASPKKKADLISSVALGNDWGFVGTERSGMEIMHEKCARTVDG